MFTVNLKLVPTVLMLCRVYSVSIGYFVHAHAHARTCTCVARFQLNSFRWLCLRDRCKDSTPLVVTLMSNLSLVSTVRCGRKNNIDQRNRRLLTPSSRSFMYITNRTGPKTEQCWTPLLTGDHSELCPLIVHQPFRYPFTYNSSCALCLQFPL